MHQSPQGNRNAQQRKSATYAPYRDFERFVLEHLSRGMRLPLGQLRHSYPHKISRSTATRTIHRLASQGLVIVQRHEQLWISSSRNSLLPVAKSATPSKENVQLLPRSFAKVAKSATPAKNPLFLSHRITFPSIRYNGTQIIDKRTKWHGRYHHIPTTYIRELTHTIEMHRTKLRIWIHDSSGSTLQEQFDDAKRKAVDRILEYSKINNLILETIDLDQILASEHTVEDRGVDQVLRPIIEEEPDLMDERLGISINQVSHPDQIEFHERRKDLRPARDRAGAVEYAVDKFVPEHWPEHVKMSLETQKAIRELTRVATELTGTVVDLRQRVEILEVKNRGG